MKTLRALIVGLVAGLSAVSLPAHAAVRINIKQIGANVVVTSIGSIDLDGLSLITETNYNSSAAIRATDAFVATGVSALTNGYAGITGPRHIGIGSLINASSGSGDPFGLNIFPVNRPAGIARIFLPLAYTSGQSINSSATFANTSLQTLGLATGRYTYLAPNDSIELSIAAPAVPEPATWAMIILGFGTIGTVVRRRRTAETSVRFA